MGFCQGPGTFSPHPIAHLAVEIVRNSCHLPQTQLSGTDGAMCLGNVRSLVGRVAVLSGRGPPPSSDETLAEGNCCTYLKALPSWGAPFLQQLRSHACELARLLSLEIWVQHGGTHITLCQKYVRMLQGTVTGSRLDFSCLYAHLFNVDVLSTWDVPGRRVYARDSLC